MRIVIVTRKRLWAFPPTKPSRMIEIGGTALMAGLLHAVNRSHFLAALEQVKKQIVKAWDDEKSTS